MSFYNYRLDRLNRILMDLVENKKHDHLEGVQNVAYDLFVI